MYCTTLIICAYKTGSEIGKNDQKKKNNSSPMYLMMY